MEFKKDNLFNVPEKPGVYLFFDKKGNLLYVGKARNLKERLKTHMTVEYENPRLRLLLNRINTFQFITTASEPEALLLENNLIKSKKPRFNIRLRDDKKYPYIKLTVNEKFPRIFTTRDLRDDGSLLIGPFHSAKSLRKALRVALKIFPIRTCKYVLPSKRKINPCLEYDLKRCPAPCVEGLVSAEEYREVVKKLVFFFSGNTKSVEDYLLDEIEKLKENLDFEKAARLRDILYSIREISRTQTAVLDENKSIDVLAASVHYPFASVCILRVRNGKLIDIESFILDNPISSDEKEVIFSFISQYYLSGIIGSEEVVVEMLREDHYEVQEALRIKRNVSIRFREPQNNDEEKLIKMAKENAEYKLEEYFSEKKGKVIISKSVVELKENLNLPFHPIHIECLDISHSFGDERVAAIVVFKNGKKDKKLYRKFKIKTEDIKSDPHMVYEVVKRRFKRLKEENGKLPDLFIIDGGKAQLSAAVKALRELDISDVAICAFAKTYDQLYFPDGRVVMIPKKSSAIKLLRGIRGEAHRFALTYHRDKMVKKIKISELDGIPGIGEKKKVEILRYFGSIERLKGASVDEISKVRGIGKKLAEIIYERLHS
ncbi:MAG: excinuclease ABC subunit UvrC [Candidatus Hydrothermales bacterium]